MAKEMVISEQRLNPSTGQVETSQFNTLGALKEQGIEFIAMPTEYVIGKKKNGEPLKLGELGCFLLTKVDDQGKILHEGNGYNLQRPLAVDLQTLIALVNLRKPQKFTEAQKK